MDYEPWPTSKAVAKWLKESKVKVLEGPSQSPDLNPIKTLWAELNKHVRTRRPTNLSQGHKFCLVKWDTIPATTEVVILFDDYSCAFHYALVMKTKTHCLKQLHGPTGTV